jgi:lysophospholipase L1-like esterase
MSLLRIAMTLLLSCYGTGFCRAAINISCVGDSITQGAGVTNPSQESYPAKLQKLLGTNYTVTNFGVSGTTLLKKGDFPYWNTLAYPSSRVRPTPAIVIIMLGTNDSKPQNWAYGSNFMGDYEALLASYTNISTNPRILLCTPPPVYGNGNFNIKPDIVATNIAPLIRELGTNYDLQVIDMHELLAGHGEWFPDNVHPNLQGTSVMAAIVYTALLGDTMNGVTPGLGIEPLSANSAVLDWPAAGAGWVLQSASALNSNNWPVVGLPAVNNSVSVRITNSITGPTAMFRLWRPTN